MNEDPGQKCLEVAERVIGCLNDGEYLKRYLLLKRRIYESSSQQPQLSQHLKAAALENRELSHERDRMLRITGEHADLEAWTITQIMNIQKRVLPDFDSSAVSIDDVIRSLQRVMAAKNESNNIIRQRMTDDNGSLRDRISAMSQAANCEIKKVNDRVAVADTKMAEGRKGMRMQIEEIRRKEACERQKTRECNEETVGIDSTLRDKQTVATALMTRLKVTEGKSAVSGRRNADLRRQADRLRREYESVTREIETQRASQRFGVAEADERELVELHAIEEEVTDLVQENNRLALELKKRKLATGVMETTEVASLSRI